MMILYFLIACSIVMALIFLGAFFWALKNGQHDDMVTPGIRMLFEEEVDDVIGNMEDGKGGPVNQTTKKQTTQKTKLSDKNHFSS